MRPEEDLWLAFWRQRLWLAVVPVLGGVALGMVLYWCLSVLVLWW